MSPQTQLHATLTEPPVAASPCLRQGVRDYLCNRMYTLDEHGIEKYMAQIVVLAVSRPSAALDRLVVDLCRRSLRLACKARARPSKAEPHFPISGHR